MSIKSKNFRNRLKEERAVVMPGAYDALTARLIEQAGFEAIIHTGYGTSATLLAAPDVGLVSFGEMCQRVEKISRSVSIPVIGDCDTGYGNVVNVRRSVREYCLAGAAGLFLEDQVWPKRCGHMFGKEIIPFEEWRGKLKAALATRDEVDPDFIIGARTDAIAVEGLDEAIRRGKMAADLGVDFVFIEAPQNIEQIERISKEIDATLMLNLIEGGRTPLVTVSEAEQLGFKMILFPLTTLYLSTKAVMDGLRILKETGTAQGYLDELVTFDDFAKIIGLDEVKEFEKKYLPTNIIINKYGDYAYEDQEIK